MLVQVKKKCVRTLNLPIVVSLINDFYHCHYNHFQYYFPSSYHSFLDLNSYRKCYMEVVLDREMRLKHILNPVHVMLCYVMLCYVMSCYVMLCYVMLCYVMLCCIMLCYVMLYYTIVNYLLRHWSKKINIVNNRNKKLMKTRVVIVPKCEHKKWIGMWMLVSTR